MNNADIRLPIKVIFPRPADFISREVKPRQWPPFPGLSPQKRSDLASQAQRISTHFAKAFPEWGSVPAVAKVTLIPEAVAKTYRPYAIFSTKTCPIIGTGSLGELFISISPKGIAALVDRIQYGEAQRTVAHLSTIQRIEPYTHDQTADFEQPAIRVPTHRLRAGRLRCRLFRHHGADAATSEKSFVQFATLKGAQVQAMNYSEGIRIFCLHGLPPENISSVRAHPAVEDLSLFPEYHAVRSVCHPTGMISADLFPAPMPGIEYGVVGLIDSGTDPNNPYLQAWVLDRHEVFVRREMQDNTHGSFVAGMIVHGKLLNANHESFPSVSSFVVDVVALDRDGKIDEYDLLTVIDAAIDKYPNVRVWNLSLGRDTPCEDGAFSPLAVALDKRMKKHDVVFVSAAGNYNKLPYRSWPLDGSIATDEDRICPPADAQRGVKAHHHHLRGGDRPPPLVLSLRYAIQVAIATVRADTHRQG
jgi:serine protease AprX